MRINTNVAALNSQRILGQTNAAAAKQIGRLSSGFRINRAADDAAGLGIANKLRADIRSMTQASRNAEQGNSHAAGHGRRGADGPEHRGADEGTGDAGRFRQRQATPARVQIDAEFQKLREELDRMVDTTKFQGEKLLDGSFGAKLRRG